MDTNIIQFQSDQVKVKTGHKVDNSAEITFVVGEYMLEKIKEFVTLTDCVFNVSVEVEK